MKKNHPAGFLHACIDVYVPCPNAKDRVDKLKGHVEEILHAREGDASEQPEPLPIAQQTGILLECLGERRGTEVRGMGGASEWPAKKRGGPWTARAEERERELADAKREAAEAKGEAAEVKTMTLAVMERMAQMEKMMQQLLAASSSPSVTLAVALAALDTPSQHSFDPQPSQPSDQLQAAQPTHDSQPSTAQLSASTQQQHSEH